LFLEGPWQISRTPVHDLSWASRFSRQGASLK
jgi:hypothetical protein